MDFKKFRWVFFFFLAAFLLRAFLAFIIWHPDVNSNADWGVRFWIYGPQKFYSANVWSFTWPNQPPGTIYIYAITRKLFEFIFSIFWWMNVHIPPFPSLVMFYLETNLYPALLKLPSILADLGIAIIIYKIIGRKLSGNKKVATLGAILFLFNPVVIYNSSIWGQTDSVISFFTLLSFYLLMSKRFTLAFCAIAISFYIKISLVIVIPIFVLYLLRQKPKVSTLVVSIAVTLSLIALLTIPFSHGEPFGWLYFLYKDKILGQQLQIITANAFNLWAGLTGIDEKPQSLFLGPFTYQVWGLFLFALSYIPIIYFLFKKQTVEKLVWSLALVALSSFILLTNMHERYLFPFFPFFTIVAITNKKLLPFYIGLSIINLLNLYNFWWFPRIDFLVNIMSWDNRVSARVLGFLSFGIFSLLYIKFLRLLKTSKI